MIDEREDFGPTLKVQREQCGITLQAIADSTKISMSLLAALERNDLSRWPKGIFRRAHFRDYVTAIGLSPEPLMAEFVRLFPEDPGVARSDGERGLPLRLALEIDPSAEARAVCRRVVVAIVEVSCVLALGSIAAWALNAGVWIASGVVGLVYYPLANVCLERKLRVRSLSALTGSHLFGWLNASAGDGKDNDEELASTPEWRPASN